MKPRTKPRPLVRFASLAALYEPEWIQELAARGITVNGDTEAEREQQKRLAKARGRKLVSRGGLHASAKAWLRSRQAGRARYVGEREAA